MPAFPAQRSLWGASAELVSGGGTSLPRDYYDRWPVLLMNADPVFRFELEEYGAAIDAAARRGALFRLPLVELEATVERTLRRDKVAGTALRNWIYDQLVTAFEGHVLALDTAIARRRGQVGLPDTRHALFAATALGHGLTLVTRNPHAFKGSRVKLFDPRGYRSNEEEDLDWRAAVRNSAAWLRSPFIRS